MDHPVTRAPEGREPGADVLVRLRGGPQDGRLVRVPLAQFQDAVRAARDTSSPDPDPARERARVVWRHFDDVWVLTAEGTEAAFVLRPPEERPRPTPS